MGTTLLTLSEAAAKLRMSVANVRREIRLGNLAAKTRMLKHDPNRRPTPRIFILQSEIDRYIEDMENMSEDAPKKRTRAVRRGALSGVYEFV